MTPVLSLIVPVKDEEEAIAPFLRRVCAVLESLTDPARESFEIVFVDDGSSDRTLERIREESAADTRIFAISFSRNFGKEAALTAGLDYARGDAVIPLDVDLQDPPEVIGPMLCSWREGFEVVYGVRDDRASDHPLKRLTADVYYRAHNYLTHEKIPAHAGDFRLMDRKVVDVIRSMPERTRFMKGLFAWAGFKQTSVQYTRPSREIGRTKFNGASLWKLALDGITSTSTIPLRIWSYIGAAVAILSFMYAAFIIIRTTLLGIDVPGYASLLVAVLFLGGLQLLSLGILGEYVGRLMVEVKRRPIYVVREKIGELS